MDPDPSQLSIISTISSGDQLLYICIFILLLIASALISGAEVAFFGLSNTELEDENEDFSRRQIVRNLLQKPKKLLATILIANNAINITSVLIFSILSDTWFENIASFKLFDFQINVRFILEV